MLSIIILFYSKHVTYAFLFASWIYVIVGKRREEPVTRKAVTVMRL